MCFPVVKQHERFLDSRRSLGMTLLVEIQLLGNRPRFRASSASAVSGLAGHVRKRHGGNFRAPPVPRCWRLRGWFPPGDRYVSRSRERRAWQLASFGFGVFEPDGILKQFHPVCSSITAEPIPDSFAGHTFRESGNPQIPNGRRSGGVLHHRRRPYGIRRGRCLSRVGTYSECGTA